MAEKIRIFTDEELNIRNDGLIKIKHGMVKLKIDFFLMMGVLLGAVRDKNFIKWDWDVELGLFSDLVIDRLDEIVEVFRNDHFKVVVVNRSYEDLKINLFYYENKFTLWGLHKHGNWMQRKSYRFPIRYFETLDIIEFQGEKYSTPNNVESLLLYIYGDWKTPKKTAIKEKYLEKKIFNKQSLIMRIHSRLFG